MELQNPGVLGQEQEAQVISCDSRTACPPASGPGSLTAKDDLPGSLPLTGPSPVDRLPATKCLACVWPPSSS